MADLRLADGLNLVNRFLKQRWHQGGSNPQNAEFAIQVSAPEEVVALYEALITAGGKKGWEPFDTSIYEDMRFAYIDDPFGVRIDVNCLLPKES